MKDDVAMVFEDLDELDPITNVKTFIPTGCTELDYCITNGSGGGIPVSKITSIAGLEATGKSLFAMQVMANAQKMGGLCVYVDTEQGLNPDFAKRIGLDLTKNFIHMGKMVSCEEVFIIIRTLCEQIHKDKIEAKKEKREPEHPFAIIVWDSIDSTPTNHDLTTENPDPTTQIAMKPRILSKNIKMLLKTAQREDVAFLFINQLRTNIGAAFGQDKYIEPGGKAVPYYASVRMRITSIGKMKAADGDVHGINTRVKVIKNRFGPPHRSAEFPIYFSYGFDDEESIVNVLKKKDVIGHKKGGRNGTQYFFKDDENTTYNIVKFKSGIRSDPTMRAKAMKYMDEAMIKNLIDPRDLELEVVSNEDGEDD